MAKKNGTGSIVQLEKGKPKGKCRKWKLVVSLGRDPLTGKYRQKNRAFHGTWSEAQKALREFVGEVEGKKVVVRTSWTFDEYAEHFCEMREASGDFADQTLYGSRKNLHQISHILGNMKIQSITPATLNAAYAQLRAGNSLSGKKLTGTSASMVHKAIKLMFDYAVKEGVVAENPCAKCDAPKRDTGKKTALSPEALHELIGKLDPTDPMEIAVILCATLGLRRGEAVGLSWGDVDFVSRTVHVRHSYDRFGNLKETKTAAGMRILPMSDFTASALQARQAFQLAKYGSGPNEFVSATPEGPVMKPATAVVTDPFEHRASPNLLSGWWDRSRAGLGVPTTTLHELRHSFLSVAAQKGVHPAVMQKLAGHASPKITLEIYTHVNMDQQREAMEAMQQVFA